MVKFKIEIDRDNCVGDKHCCEEAPSTFEVDQEGKAVVTNPDGDPPEDILAAAQNCRLEGIVLYDSDTGEKLWPSESASGPVDQLTSQQEESQQAAWEPWRDLGTGD